MREAICNYYLGDNQYHSDGATLQRDFDMFFKDAEQKTARSAD